MSKTNEEILLEYEKIRLKNEKERDNRLKKIYEKFPRLKEIQKEMNKITYRYIINNAIENMDIKAQKEKEFLMNEEIKKLEKEKIEILKNNNIKPEELEIKYNCSNCKDTGFYIKDTKSVECYCFKQRQIDEKYKNSNINIIDKKTLENFSLDYFKEDVNGINQKEKVSKLIEYLKEYISNFNNVRLLEKPCIIISGDTGTGKTHLIEAVGNEIIEKNYTVLFENSSIIFSKLVEYRFSDMKKYNELVSYLNEVDLLIIDDLGTEFLTEIKLEEMYTLFNSRLYNNKPILFSTNLKAKQIGKKYNDRITSRILSKSRIFGLIGDDIRIEKAKKSVNK